MFITGTSSSSASGSSSDDSETEDELPNKFRGRAFSQTEQKGSPNGHSKALSPSSVRRRRSPLGGSSGDSAGGSGMMGPRIPFTRSRSPVVNPRSSSRSQRHMSPSASRTARNRTTSLEPDNVLPRMLEFRLQFLPTHWTWSFSADMRKCVESWIILGAVLFGTFALSNLPDLKPSDLEACKWIVLGKVTFRLLL
jgi:hypothetical protein